MRLYNEFRGQDFVLFFNYSIHNILNKPILLNFPKEFKTEAMEKLKNFNYKMNKNESNVLLRPRNIEELNILNDGIESIKFII